MKTLVKTTLSPKISTFIKIILPSSIDINNVLIKIREQGTDMWSIITIDENMQAPVDINKQYEVSIESI